MIVNTKVNSVSEPQLVLKAQDNQHYAVVLVALCNYKQNDTVVDVFLVPNGKQTPKFDNNNQVTQGNEETFFLSGVIVRSSSTVLLNTEKLLLQPGDAIYARVRNENTEVSVHVSFETY